MNWLAQARGGGTARVTVAAIAVAAGAWGWTPAAAAQTAVTTGTISGQIKDTTGSTLPGVAVSATRIETNRTATVTSDADGRYRFLSLDVGAYRVTAELQGFRTETASVTLTVGATIDVSLVLQPSVSEHVNVTGEALAVEVARTQAAETVRPGRDPVAAAQRPELSRSRAAHAGRVAHEHGRRTALRGDVGGAWHRHLGRESAQHQQHVSGGRPVGQ